MAGKYRQPKINEMGKSSGYYHCKGSGKIPGFSKII
jgi:hypothetical protein